MRSIVFIGIVFLGACKPTTTTQRQDDDISIPLEDFALTERSGTKVSNKDLLGKVWIASFVFTRCTQSCPQVTATVRRLQDEFDDANDVRFVTFTVDPERDNPSELREYADRYQAHKDRWLFLTGEEKRIHELLNKGFKVGAGRNPLKDQGEEFNHVSRLVLVDRQGNIRGYYEGMADPTREGSQAELEASLKKLKDKVGVLLREK